MYISKTLTVLRKSGAVNAFKCTVMPFLNVTLSSVNFYKAKAKIIISFSLSIGCYLLIATTIGIDLKFEFN